jgi:hypothetical protein
MSDSSGATHDHSEPFGGVPASEREPSMIGTPFVPVAEPLPESGMSEPVPAPEEWPPGPPVPEPPIPIPPLGPGLPRPPWPFPSPWKFCWINLRAGCYRITFRPTASLNDVYRGTMRVDSTGGTTTISGDLYRFFVIPEIELFPEATPVATASRALQAAPAALGMQPRRWPYQYGIPIYARDRYYSYLRVTGIQRPPILTTGPCQLTLTAQEYVYTPPPAGSFNGIFPAPPGTRTVTVVLEQKPPPAGYTSTYLTGTLYENGVAQGTFDMGWVSESFRRAHLEIDTLQGAVAPQAVSGPAGGTEDIRSVFATAGWDLTVTYDQTNIPVPAGVNATACAPSTPNGWSSANLHALMTNVRNPATNLDAQWRMHLVVVPATMGCGRGVMYDQIGVPREGVASFSDDGYPSSQSANFGTAANQLQRNVPRAFLRSACHEVGHGFNQIHQEQEAGADNSIMTTTPSVADVLGGPPGVFPDQINLAFNEHVRHHLVHFPDPVVRPGGMTFGTGHISSVPEADRQYFPPEELALDLEIEEDRIELGEPLLVRWRLTNHTDDELPVPTSIAPEAQHAFITVTNPRGRGRLMPSFVIQTDQVKIAALAPGDSLEADTRLFWSSRGFAFEEPGRHDVEVRVVWTVGGVPFGVQASAPVWVNYPRSDVDNEAASTLLHPSVGMYIALGGGADHLTEAVERLDRVAAAEADREAPRALRGLRDVLPPAGRGRAGGRRGTTTRKAAGQSSTRRKATSRKPR